MARDDDRALGPLRAYASEAFRWRYSVYVMVAFSLISINYYEIEPRLAFSYIPTLIAVFFCSFAIHVLRIPYFCQRAEFLVDVCSFLILMGATATIIISKIYSVVILTAPIEISLISVLPLGFHSVAKTTYRNLSFIAFIVVALLVSEFILGLPILDKVAFMQIVLGSLGGLFFSRLILKKFVADQMLNDLLSTEREFFYQELKTKYFPHQIQMISQGFRIDRTLPLGRGTSFCLKFDIVGSTKIMHPQAENIFEQIFEQIETYLTSDIEIISADPIRIRGKGFLAASAGDAVFLCLGYPFEYDYANNPKKIITEIEIIIGIFEASFEKNFSEEISVCVSMVYENIRCGFATNRRSYSISGPGIFLAERYENLRKKFVYIEGLAKKGRHVLVLQNKAYAFLEDVLHNSHVEMYCFGQSHDEKHVRDDPQGDCFYVTEVKARPAS